MRTSAVLGAIPEGLGVCAHLTLCVRMFTLRGYLKCCSRWPQNAFRARSADYGGARTDRTVRGCGGEVMMMLRRKWEDPTGSDTPPQRRATAMVAQGREHAARDPHVLTLALIASHEHGTQSGQIGRAHV